MVRRMLFWNAISVSNSLFSLCFRVLFYLNVQLQSLIQKCIQLLYFVLIDFSFLISLTFVPESSIDGFLKLFTGDTVELTIALTVIIFELTLIDLLIFPSVDAKTLFLIKSVIALKEFILILPDSISMSNSLLEVSLINTVIIPVILSIPICNAVYILTYFNILVPT